MPLDKSRIISIIYNVMRLVLCVLYKKEGHDVKDLEKKTYLKPEMSLVRFTAEDVICASNLPPVGNNETPVVVF